MTKRASVESTAEAYLELLAARGVEYFFANSGTDFAPLIDAYAKRLSQGQALPRPMTIPHETPAVSMAHGYAMVTGRPQVVMVHVIVGAGSAVGGIINAARSNVPIIFSAGRNPLTESGMHGSRNRAIHWAQESFDQAGMIREFVKWDYELRNFGQLETVVDRALSLAQAEPQGPIYLTLPREVLAEKQETFEYAEASRAPRPAAVDAALSGTVSLNLVALADAVRPRVDASSVGERTRRWHAEHRRLREAWAATARKAGSEKPLEMVWVSKCIGDLIDDKTILVDEYDFDPTQGCFRTPGTYFGSSPAGGLGWGLGAALGAKLAAPDKTVICCVGDGAYIFGAPTAAHFVSRAYNLPALFVIFNNRAWNAVKRAVRSHAPTGAGVKAATMPLSDLEPAPDYEMVCRASGGHAERVEDPAALPEALARALKVVRDEMRQALLNVICKKP